MAGYGLIGEKLGHSYSKTIHEMLGEYDYDLIPLSREEFDAFMKERSFKALNVTIPYKKAVMPYCDKLSPLAEKLGAVNTLYFDEEGALCGTNTDYPGFLKAAASAEISFEGRKVLILGDGGAGGMVRHAVKDSGASSVTVVTRHPETSPARDLFKCVSYDQLDSYQDSEIIVNTTPVGMYPDNGKRLIDLSVFAECKGVFDVIYNPQLTDLLLQAKKAGIPYANGLSMLVSQATEAAAYFTGKPGWDSRDQEILSADRYAGYKWSVIWLPPEEPFSLVRDQARHSSVPFGHKDNKKEGLYPHLKARKFTRWGASDAPCYRFRDLLIPWAFPNARPRWR